MRKYVLSFLVENEQNALTRVSTMFSSRGYEIESISASKYAEEKYTKITLVAMANELVIKQIERLVDVLKVAELQAETSIFRELALVKINTNNCKKDEVLKTFENFNASVCYDCSDSVIAQIVGECEKIDRFLKELTVYEVCEVSRTGITGIQKGA